jgi:uncharacterized Zn finger protein (UPF0148 family)
MGDKFDGVNEKCPRCGRPLIRYSQKKKGEKVYKAIIWCAKCDYTREDTNNKLSII